VATETNVKELKKARSTLAEAQQAITQATAEMNRIAARQQHMQ
jgi:hypothetical protein